MKRLMVLLMAVAAFVLIGCSDSKVDLVRDGVLNYDQSTTVGKVIDGFAGFDDVEWSSMTSEQGRDYVVAIGEHKHKFKEVDEIVSAFEFIPNTDGKTFNFNAQKCIVICKNGEKTEYFGFMDSSLGAMVYGGGGSASLLEMVYAGKVYPGQGAIDILCKNNK